MGFFLILFPITHIYTSGLFVDIRLGFIGFFHAHVLATTPYIDAILRRENTDTRIYSS